MIARQIHTYIDHRQIIDDRDDINRQMDRQIADRE